MTPQHPKMKSLGAVGLAFALGVAFPCIAAAQDLSLVAAFDQAAAGRGGTESTIAFHAAGCDFGETIVNIGLCQWRGQGEGDRVIRKNVFLGEVTRMSAKPFTGPYGDRFVLTFDFEYEKPSPYLIVIDRLLYGGAVAFERLRERNAAAIARAEFRSGKTYSECGGPAEPDGKDTSMSFFLAHEPEGWRRLIEVARACRGGKPLTVEDGFAGGG